MTPDEIRRLAGDLAWSADRLRGVTAAVEKQSEQTTWNGGARRRFDAELGTHLASARRLNKSVSACAAELKRAAGRLDHVLQGLRADERDVRSAYEGYLKGRGVTGSNALYAIRRLPPSLDPQWAQLAHTVLGRSHTQGYL
ncbi:hypothetical protein [Actinomadura sp. DC4]|uniref:WXG100 family type VII secretion target n=1 Tax=Actinomadura sp. DC4 TaxID=3055069 RepID=UPI0025AFE5F5|nr:hypothetical protein [Actinomadura sp. DC4]MDN3357089.1 hypothetical protein [Actinomadura sp. DC4]